MTTIDPQQTLDCGGDACPMLLSMTRKAMENLAAGEILEVLGTDPGFKNDPPA